MKKILFICTGNLCRSAFADFFMKTLTTENSPLFIDSAGIYAGNGRQPPEDAVIVGQEFRVDLKNHKAKLLTSEMIKNFDTLIIMEELHLSFILAIVPEVSLNKIHYLGSFSDNSQKEIADPYGLGLQVYRQCFGKIAECVSNFYNKIIYSFLD
jgi:protein-tyrosine-phosphatase